MNQFVAIFGATSAIAHETAKLFASQGSQLLLIGRSQAHLAANAADIIARGAKQVETITADLADTSSHDQLWTKCRNIMPQIDTVLLAHGYLGDQKIAAESFKETSKIFEVNALSPISLLTVIANDFERKKAGTIAVITSVAGDRGRQSNYVYGASKAAVICFLSGLRNRLFASGIKVIDIRPGFIDTPMTQHLQNKPLVASASLAGKQIFSAILAGKDIIYVPKRWQLVMTIIRLIPEQIFKRLGL
jgi:decaprenylphospho-beta-D-erythro-pentofuranosid-2-ulose 2-reductase